MRHTFQTEQWVPYPREQVFRFFADPANLPPLMPAWQRARIDHAQLVAPAQGAMDRIAAGKGSSMTISFRPLPFFPLRLRWGACITDFCWDESFCDEQRKGPFRYFRHCHRLRDEVRDRLVGTVVSDGLEYELPLGILGDVANRVAVRAQIRSLFQHRQKTLLSLLAGRF